MEDSHPEATALTPEAEAVLARAWDDWVSLGEAREVVSEVSSHSDPAALREATIDTIALLLDQHLAQAGDLAPRFVAWTLEPAEVIERIRGEWTDPGAGLLPGDVCWLAGTAAGLEIGDKVLERNAQQDDA